MSWLADLVGAGTRAAARAAGVATSLGAKSMRAAAATGPGRVAIDALLDRLSDRDVRFDAEERRAAFLALATESAAAATRETFTLAEAMGRLAAGDGRPLKRAVEDGIEDVRRLAESADMQELLPAPMVSDRLRERARLLVERTPERLLEALAPEGGDARPGEVMSAALADAGNLRVFLALYPQVLMLIGADVGRVLAAGEVSFSELEAFMEGRRRMG